MAQSAQDLPPVADHLVDEAERQLGSAPVPLGRRLRVFDLVRMVARATGPHHVTAFAGNLAYNAFLAIVPFLLFLVSALRAVHAPDLLSNLIDVLSATLPASSAHLLRDQVQPEVTSRVPDMWLFSLLLASGALWACSAAFRAVASAMNVMYETSDDRPVLARLAGSILLSLATAALMLVAFALVEGASHYLAAVTDAPFPLIWTLVKWIIVTVGAFVAFAATYAFVPQVKRPIRAIAPGAAFATIASVFFSLGFAFVFDVFSTILVDPLYGWFTGLFALVLYLYWLSFILLLGAELNHAIETHGAFPPS